MNLWEKAHVVHRAWRFRLKSERPKILFLLKHLALGQIALDIGAHKGAYAWWMAKRVGPTGRVIAFEPQPGLAAYLDEIKAAFRFDQLAVVRAALSSSEGAKDLFRPAVNPRGGATLEKMATEGTTVSVPAVMLDACLDEHSARPVRFIKCDVEGHELEVFRGGRRMLGEDRPVLLFECQDFRHPEGQIRRVFEYLYGFGYEGYFFEKGRLAPVSQFRVDVHQQGAGPMYRDDFAFLPGKRP